MPPKIQGPTLEKKLSSFQKEAVDDGKFARLKKLGAEKLGMIDAMIVSGTPSLQIAQTIQQNWLMIDDVSLSALAKMIERYKLQRIDLTTSLRETAQAITVMDQVETRMEELKALEKSFKRRDMDVLDEMAELILMQKTRILDAHKKERSIGFPFQWLSKDINIQRELLHEMKELQFEMGINERKDKPLPQTGGISIYNNTATAVYSDGAKQYIESKRRQENYMAVTADILQILGDGDKNDGRSTERDETTDINES